MLKREEINLEWKFHPTSYPFDRSASQESVARRKINPCIQAVIYPLQAYFSIFWCWSHTDKLFWSENVAKINRASLNPSIILGWKNWNSPVGSVSMGVNRFCICLLLSYHRQNEMTDTSFFLNFILFGTFTTSSFCKKHFKTVKNEKSTGCDVTSTGGVTFSFPG